LWVAGALLAAACQPSYDGVRMRVYAGNGDALGESIEIGEGQAMAVEVRPVSRNPYEDYEDFNLVELISANQSIVFVAPADDVNRFVVGGAGRGRASIELRIDGKSEDFLDAEVVQQPPGVGQ
jgi:hypothetical protein